MFHYDGTLKFAEVRSDLISEVSTAKYLPILNLEKSVKGIQELQVQLCCHDYIQYRPFVT